MLLYITCEYENTDFLSPNAFKVLEIWEAAGKEYTFLIDQAKPYFSLDEVKQDIAAELKIDIAEVELEEL